ncbi:CorA-like Mg2+ transporter protein [Streptococcus pneumoniae]|nr:CorA-like Mg2+ transporter protein [Streptococcus pneumoniae]
MVLEKQLGNGCTWIDLDLGKLNKLEDLSEIYGLDKETIEYALDRNERATWTTTVKVGRLPLSIMS